MQKIIKKMTLYAAVSAFAIAAVWLIASSGKNSPSGTTYSAGFLAAAETDFDFKKIAMKDGNVAHEFEIKNNGSDPVIIEKVSTSCMCTTAYITDSSGEKYGGFGMPGHGGAIQRTNIEVKPGEAIMLEAVFD